MFSFSFKSFIVSSVILYKVFESKEVWQTLSAIAETNSTISIDAESIIFF